MSTEPIAYMLAHISGTFAAAEQSFPDLMEPYSTLLGEAQGAEEKLDIMRRGLRETIARRYPMAEVREVVAVEPDRQERLAL